jgi:hypothetical protein
VRPAAVISKNSRSSTPPARPADRLRELARHVLRLGQCGWSDPERFTIATETIASEMQKLTQELGR